MHKSKNYSLLNWGILASQFAGIIVCMEFFIRSPHWVVSLLILIFFSLMMQGTFSLLHDCIHGHGDQNTLRNYWMGVLSSTLFGTSYTLYKVNHQGHHVRNRSKAEMAEYILPEENAWAKRSIYYFAVLGGIWLGSFLGSIFLLFVPFKAIKHLALRTKSMDGYWVSFLDFKPEQWLALKLEVIFGILFWTAVISISQWPILDLAIAYLCFGISYSSLQWIYHLRTPLHPVEGAYNLRAPWLIRILFLNFNYNYTHHLRPDVPWPLLHVESDLSETQPLWYRWINVLRPPEPLPKDLNQIRKVYF